MKRPERREYTKRDLLSAAKNGETHRLKDVLKTVPPTSTDDQGMTALMWAALNRMEGCVRVLLTVSDVSQKDHKGLTALHWAAQEKSRREAADFSEVSMSEGQLPKKRKVI